MIERMKWWGKNCETFWKLNRFYLWTEYGEGRIIQTDSQVSGMSD